MPYKTRKVDNKYCVYKKDGGKKVGCTKGTEKAKKKYLAALHIAEDEVEVKMESFKLFFESKDADVEDLKNMIKNPDPSKVKEYGGTKYVDMLKKKLERAKKSQAILSHLKKSPIGRVIEDEQSKIRKGGAGKSPYTGTRVEKDKKKEQSKKQARDKVKPEDAEDRCKRKADSVYGKKTSAYKSGAIVRCRKGKIWKKK